MLILQLWNSHTLFAQWELSPEKINLIHEHYNTEWQYMRPFLRLYDITGLIFDGGQAHELRQISVKQQSSCYIRCLKLGRTYIADLGIWNRQDQFLPLIRSNRITLPSAEGMEIGASSLDMLSSDPTIFPSGRYVPQDYDHFSAYTVYTPVFRSKKQQNPTKEDENL
jgi:hypothetical protein